MKPFDQSRQARGALNRLPPKHDVSGFLRGLMLRTSSRRAVERGGASQGDCKRPEEALTVLRRSGEAQLLVAAGVAYVCALS